MSLTHKIVLPDLERVKNDLRNCQLTYDRIQSKTQNVVKEIDDLSVRKQQFANSMNKMKETLKLNENLQIELHHKIENTFLSQTKCKLMEAQHQTNIEKCKLHMKECCFPQLQELPIASLRSEIEQMEMKKEEVLKLIEDNFKMCQ